MTIGPAPMIRMLAMSVRLGIGAHQRDEAREQIMAVLRAGTGLRVVLDRKDRPVDDAQPLIAAVEQRDVGRLDILGQALRIDDEAVVLAGDRDPAGGKLFDRVVGAAMAARHLVSAPAERKSQQLMAKANAEDRLPR